MTLYIGVGFHPHQQTACWCDTNAGEIITRKVFHKTKEPRNNKRLPKRW